MGLITPTGIGVGIPVTTSGNGLPAGGTIGQGIINAGPGVGAWGNILQPGNAPLVKTASYQLLSADSYVQYNCASGNLVATLPTSPVVGQLYGVQKIDATANTLTVTPSSGTINGAANVLLTQQYQAVLLAFDGTNWEVLGDAGDNLAIQLVSANTTLTSGNLVAAVDTSGGARTVTLPSAVGRSGQTVMVYKITTDANPVTVNTQLSQKIGINRTSQQWWALGPAFIVMSDGANWTVVLQDVDPSLVPFRFYDTGAVDSTADMKTAVTVAVAIAASMNDAVIEMEANRGGYNLNAAPVTTGGAYAVVPLTALTTGNLTIRTRGPSTAYLAPNIFVTTRADGWSAGNGQPSLFGGPAAGKGGAALVAQLRFENIGFSVPTNPRIASIDASGFFSLTLHNVITTTNQDTVQCTSTDGPSFICPLVNNVGCTATGVVASFGTTATFVLGEHLEAACVVNQACMASFALTAAYHRNHVDHAITAWNKYDICAWTWGTGPVIIPAPGAGLQYTLDIDTWDNETSTAANQTTTKSIWDDNNNGNGTVSTFSRVLANAGLALTPALIGVGAGQALHWTVVDKAANLVTPTVGSLVNLGAGATASISGTDVSGFVQINTGTVPPAGGSFTVTFGTPYIDLWGVLISVHDASLASGLPYVVGGLTSFVVHFVNALAASSTFFVYYQVTMKPPQSR